MNTPPKRRLNPLVAGLTLLVLIGLSSACDSASSDDPGTMDSDSASLPDQVVDATPEMVDPCATVANICTLDSPVCDSNRLRFCATDPNGCEIETSTACDDVVGGSCTNGECIVDPCASQSTCDEGTRCSDNDEMLLLCERDNDGCLRERSIDCVSSNRICGPTMSGALECTGVCNTRCEFEGDRWCNSPTTVVVCVTDSLGCVNEVVELCGSSETCDDDPPGTARCVFSCNDAPECSGREDTVTCNGAMIETCADGNGDGCQEFLVTDCGDGTCDESTTPVCTIPGELEIGVTDLFSGDSMTWRELVDGGGIPTFQGFQGSWMIVLTVRTRALIASPMDFDASVTLTDGGSSSLQLVDYTLSSASDGWSYAYDLMLDLGSFEPPELGTRVTIDLSIVGALGTTVDVTLDNVIDEQIGI